MKNIRYIGIRISIIWLLCTLLVSCVSGCANQNAADNQDTEVTGAEVTASENLADMEENSEGLPEDMLAITMNREEDKAYFDMLEGEWVAVAYVGVGTEYHFEEAAEEGYQESREAYINEMIKEYAGSEYRIEADNLEYFRPIPDLGYTMEDDDELFLFTRFAHLEFEMTPPYIGVHISLKDKDESYNVIIDADGTVLIGIGVCFFRLERKSNVVAREFFTKRELERIQELMQDDYHTLLESIMVSGRMKDHKISGGRLLEAYAPMRKQCEILLYYDGRIYISYYEPGSDEKFYTNTEDEEMPPLVLYLVDEDVQNNVIFDAFVKNEISAYDLISQREMYWTDYYEDYHYESEATGEFWAIYGIHFMAEDLDGDRQDELLVYLQQSDTSGDLFVFDETDGELYAWEKWEDFLEMRMMDIEYHGNGIFSKGGGKGDILGQYNSEGRIEYLLKYYPWYEATGPDGVLSRGAELVLYKDGAVDRELAYEGEYDPKTDSWEMTLDNQSVKEECDRILNEIRGKGEQIIPIEWEDKAEKITLEDLLRTESAPDSVYDGELTLTLGMTDFFGYYGEEYIPSHSTPTQLVGTELIDEKYYKWYFYDFTDIGVILTNYNKRTGDSDRYIVCMIDLRTPRFHTSRGIKVGDTLEELMEAYGDDLEMTDVYYCDCRYDYVENGITTSFYIEQNIIAEIEMQ